MRRLLLIGLAVAAIAPAVAVYAVAALGAPAADGKLIAMVGPAATISLTNSAGAPVTQLDPGTYDIEIDDRSVEHNFHVYGPGGVSAGTEIEFVGIRTVTVTLTNGEYTFVCDAHAYDMIGQFQVGAGGGNPPPPPPPSGGGGSLPKLVGTVGPRMTISLTKGGTKVKTLKPGRYAITVRDRSPIHNFRLKGPGLNKATGIAYVGKAPTWTTWTVKLVAGKYSYFCNPHKADMHGSFTVR
jgi:plastocyanin